MRITKGDALAGLRSATRTLREQDDAQDQDLNKRLETEVNSWRYFASKNGYVLRLGSPAHHAINSLCERLVYELSLIHI